MKKSLNQLLLLLITKKFINHLNFKYLYVFINNQNIFFIHIKFFQVKNTLNEFEV